MAIDPLRIEEHLHGHLGWLTAAALVHPAIVLRRYGRRAHLAVTLSTALITLTGALGVMLYGPYRSHLRQGIFATAPAVGYLFERKEHLGFGAVLMAWAGFASYVAAQRVHGAGYRRSLQRAAHWAFVVAAGFAVCVALMGTLVAAYRSF